MRVQVLHGRTFAGNISNRTMVTDITSGVSIARVPASCVIDISHDKIIIIAMAMWGSSVVSNHVSESRPHEKALESLDNGCVWIKLDRFALEVTFTIVVLLVKDTLTIVHEAFRTIKFRYLLWSVVLPAYWTDRILGYVLVGIDT